MADADHKLRGIGGWLAVFLALLGLIAAIQAYALFQGVSYWFSRQSEALGIIPLPLVAEGWLIAAARIAIALVILRRMIHVRRWSSVRLCIAGLWTYYVGLALVDAIAAAAIVMVWREIPVRPDLWLVGSALSKGCLIAFSGTWYLLRSRRVAGTYPRPSESDALREVFG